MEQARLLELIEKSRAGDRLAQERLVGEAQNRVYYHCKKMLKNEEDALDATQDVLLTMLTSLDKLRQPAAFWGWVNGITANRCRHLLTQGTKEWQIPEDDEGNSLLDTLENLDDPEIREKLLDYFIDKIYVYDDHLEITGWFSEDRREIEWTEFKDGEIQFNVFAPSSTRKKQSSERMTVFCWGSRERTADLLSFNRQRPKVKPFPVCQIQEVLFVGNA